MKQRVILVGLLLVTMAIDGKADEKKVGEIVPDKTLLLYPEGQSVDKGIWENGKAVTLGPEESNGLTGPTVFFSEEKHTKNVGDDAHMELYFPRSKKKRNGQMVVVCPGGGYWFNAMNNEGRRVAEWLIAKGIYACVLKYRMPNGHPHVPLVDIQNTFRYCRTHAEEWGIRQIGVMGFSAGGHLASMASNMYVDETTKPDFAILLYPWISCCEDDDSALAFPNMVGKENASDQQMKDFYSMDKKVTKDTPPTYLAMSIDDNLLNLDHVFKYVNKLRENKVKGEMYIFPQGRHGWGFTFGKYGKDTLGNARKDFLSTLERFLNELKRETK